MKNLDDLETEVKKLKDAIWNSDLSQDQAENFTMYLQDLLSDLEFYKQREKEFGGHKQWSMAHAPSPDPYLGDR